MISTSSSARPEAKSTRPRLSDTLSSARRTRTSPGAVTSVPRRSIDIVHQHHSWVGGVATHVARGYQCHRAGQQPVLDLMYTLLDLGDGGRIRKLQRLLKDDWPTVDSVVDEVHRRSGDLDPVRHRLLDGRDAGKGGEQRRVHVDDPAAEAPNERRAEELHETGEHH